jgi:uncharacterized RDD family membrane protein YckC
MQTAEAVVSPAAASTARDLVGHEIHPWRRYFARIVDMNLSLALVLMPVVFVACFLIALVSPATVDAFAGWMEEVSGNRIANILLTCLLWVPLETLFMCTLGTTPGKWVFGIRVRDEHGGKLKPALALKRAASVYFQGLGMGLPLVSLITLVMSYNRLTKESITAWDERLGTAVMYLPVGVLRGAGMVITLVLAMLLLAYGAV